jgi:hypothetical protein
MFGIFLTSIRGSLGKIDQICSRILLPYSIAIKEPVVIKLAKLGGLIVDERMPFVYEP